MKRILGKKNDNEKEDLNAIIPVNAIQAEEEKKRR